MAEFDLTEAVTALLRRALAVYAGAPASVVLLEQAAARLDGPLRVAIAGKVKAGKSTLLNALVGELIAPTDAGECTRIVTWYRHGSPARLAAVPFGAPACELALATRPGSTALDLELSLDLAGLAATEIEHLLIDWPSAELAATTLIDTPGTASVHSVVSARTENFLTRQQEAVQADAMVYLMRHVHADDIAFLQAFHATGGVGAGPVNTVAVLSRADEIGAGRVDALDSAHRIADRMHSQDTVRALCQAVVPVAALIAETGRTLRAEEFVVLAELATLPPDLLHRLLLTADRFVAGAGPVLGREATLGARLLDRFGMFGLRAALGLVGAGCPNAETLAAELIATSGLNELTRTLRELFTERADLLKARSALRLVERLARDTPTAGSAELLAQIERITAGTHEFVELALLGRLRAGAIPLDAAGLVAAERLLGGHGRHPTTRLGLPADADPAIVAAVAGEALARWRKRSENPVAVRALAEASRVVARSCEGILAGCAAHSMS